MKSAVVLLASLAVVSAQQYFLQAGYFDTTCATQTGASATLMGTSTASGNNGNSICQASSNFGTYQTCTVSGSNIVLTTNLCSNNTVVQTQTIANNQCVTPGNGQLPGALTPASKYQCVTGASNYNYFTPKVESWFGANCNGPAPVAVTPSVGICFRQQTTNPYIQLNISNTQLGVGYNCTFVSNTQCSACQSSYFLPISSTECLQSTNFDAVFGYPANTYYRVSQPASTTTTGRNGAATVVPMLAATVAAVAAFAL